MRLCQYSIDLTPYNEKKYLISVFIAFITIKSILSLFFTPVQWSDEYVWYNVAFEIFKSNYGELVQPYHYYPIGYPAILSVANLFSGEKEIVYHIMLVINSILTSSILFPSFYILKRYIPGIQAFLGSILVAVLPTVMLYNFILMTENLFVPLVVFSVWVLLESFERNSILWDIFAGISIFYLYFTRDTTGVVFIIAFIVAQVFFLLTSGHETMVRNLKNKAILLLIIVIPLSSWMFYKVFLSNQSTYFFMDEFIKSFFHLFSEVSSIKSFFTLFLYHIDYLVLSSYILFFVLTGIIILASLVRSDSFTFNASMQEFFSETNSSLRSVIMYFLTFSLGLQVINVVYIISDPELTSYYGFIQGRYIYPVVPVVFIFGIIGFYLLHNNGNPGGWMPKTLFILSIPLVLLSAYVMPFIKPTIVNNYSLIYVSYLTDNLGIIFNFVLLTGIFVIIPLYFLKVRDSNFPGKFLFYFILLTLVLSLPTYELQLKKVESENNVNQIAKYLQKHDTPDTVTLMAGEEYVKSNFDGRIEFYRDKFWANGKMDLLYNSNYSYEELQKGDYLISKKWLSYRCVCSSYIPDGYKLYDLHTQIGPYTWGTAIPFGREGTAVQYQVSGWSFPEDGFTWTYGNSSTLMIPVDTIPDTVFFTIRGRAFTGPGLSGQRAILLVNDNEIPEPVLMDSTVSRFTLPVPTRYLKIGDNLITLRLPDASSPKELRISQDARMLGLGVSSVSFSSVRPDSPAGG